MASSLAVSPGRGAVFSARVGYMGVVRGHHGIVPRCLPWPWGRVFSARWIHGYCPWPSCRCPSPPSPGRGAVFSVRVGYIGVVRGHHGIVPRHLPWPWGRAFSARWIHGCCPWPSWHRPSLSPLAVGLCFQRALDTWVLSVAIMASSLAVSPGRGAVFSARVGYMGVVRGHHGIVPRCLPWPWGRVFSARWIHGYCPWPSCRCPSPPPLAVGPYFRHALATRTGAWSL